MHQEINTLATVAPFNNWPVSKRYGIYSYFNPLLIISYFISHTVCNTRSPVCVLRQTPCPTPGADWSFSHRAGGCMSPCPKVWVLWAPFLTLTLRAAHSVALTQLPRLLSSPSRRKTAAKFHPVSGLCRERASSSHLSAFVWRSLCRKRPSSLSSRLILL